MRRILWGVARSTYVSNSLPFLDRLAFAQAFGIALEVRVVVAEILTGVELVDRDTTRLAQEQPGDRAVLDGSNRSVPRREDVYGLMPARPPAFVRELPG